MALNSVLAALILAALPWASAEAQPGNCPDASEAETRRLRAEVDDLRQRGRSSEAIARTHCLAEMAGKVFGRDHPTTLNILDELAALLRTGGRAAEAAEIEKRVTLAHRPADDHSPGIAELNLLLVQSKTLLDRRDVDGAANVCLEARQLAVARGLTRHLGFAAVLNECGRVFEAYGTYPMAEERYRESADLAQATGGPRNPQRTTALNNLGLLYWKQGKNQQAREALEAVVAIEGKANPEGIPALVNLALVYGSLGRSAEARELLFFARDLTLSVYGRSHPGLISIFNNLGAQAWRAGRLEEAVDWHEQATAVTGRNVATIIALGSERQKLAYIASFAYPTYASATLSVSDARSRRAAEMALQAILQYKGLVLDAMSDSVARLRKSVRPGDRALLEQFTSVAGQLSALTHQGDVPLETYRQRREDLARRQEALEAQLAGRSSEFRREATPVSLTAVRRAIPPGAALVEWFRYLPYQPHAKENRRKWGKPRYAAYVLKSEGEPAALDMGEADGIEALIAEFRGALSDPKRTYVKELAEELSGKLIAPLRPHLDRTERLLMSPDGALNLLPFAALVDDRGQYLAKRFEIVYLTSGRDLLRFDAEPGSGAGAVVVVANPDYGTALGHSGLVFEPLSGTAAEAMALKTLLGLGDQSVLTGVNATETNLKQLRGPRVLHVATHGFFLSDEGASPEENPLLRSGLALAGANRRRSGPNQDGLLTAFEVAQLDLRGTELVVLSACETGVGEVQNGEGVYGLRRALVLAGAQAQVASLWKVPDTATKDLMVDYYERLLKGEGRSAALRKVQEKMIDSPDRRHPYYWAAFVAIGNWAPMTAR